MPRYVPRKKRRAVVYFSAAVLGAFVCLLSAALVPMVASLDPRLERLRSGAVLAAYRDPHSIDHPIRLSSSPDLVLSSGVIVADAAAAARGVSRLLIDRPEFLLRLSGSGGVSERVSAHSLDHGELPDVIGPLLRQLHGFKVDQVQIRGGSLTVSWPGGEEVVRHIDVELAGLVKGQLSGTGRLTYLGQPFAVVASVGALTQREISGQAVSSRALKMHAKSPVVTAAFDGALEMRTSPVLRGVVDATAPDLAVLAAWIGSPELPAQAFRDVHLRGEMTWAEGSVSLDRASVGLNGQAPATGVVSLSRENGVPHVEATLAFDVMDLASFLALPRRDQGADPGSGGGWRDMSLQVPFARTLRADVRASASRATFKGQPLGKSAVSVTVADGKLLLDLAEMEHAGGRTSGQLSIDSLSGKVAVRGRIDTASLGPILTDLAGVDLLAGKGAMQVDVAAIATDVGQFISTAEGRITVTAGPQAQLGADLLPVRTVLAQARLPAWQAISTAPAQFDAFEAKAVLQNGRVHVDSASLRAGSTALSASGQFNPRSREMDLLLGLRESRVADRGRAVGQPDTVRYVLLRGPWSSPQVLPSEPGSLRP